jgi:hypothetical protein
MLVATAWAYLYPWTNPFDFRFSKVTKVKETVTFEPAIEVYNLFSSSAVTSAVTIIGSSLLRPSAIVDRILLCPVRRLRGQEYPRYARPVLRSGTRGDLTGSVPCGNNDVLISADAIQTDL